MADTGAPTQSSQDYGSGFGLRMGILAQRATDMLGVGGAQNSKFTTRGWRSDAPWTGGPTTARFRSNASDITAGALNHAAQLMPELPQERYMNKALDIIGRTPTGKGLLQSAEQGSVKMLMDTQYAGVGCYRAMDRTITVNPRSMMNKGNPEAFTGEIGNILSHELCHAYQDSNDALRVTHGTSELAIGESALALHHLEAGAYAMEAQVAFEAREMGHPELWNNVDAHHKPVFDAFENAVRENPAALKNGEARRAAHDSYFKNPNLRTAYEAQIVRKYKFDNHDTWQNRNGEWIKGASIGGTRVDPAVIVKMGKSPDGTNHLEIAGKPSPGDPSYRGFADKVMQREVEQMRKQEIALGGDPGVTDAPTGAKTTPGMDSGGKPSAVTTRPGATGPKAMTMKPPALTPPAPKMK